MKNRATLSLIEQIIMIAVFAVAAAVSLRVFVYADKSSEAGLTRDFAVAQTQNAAEIIKARGGDLQAAAKLLGGTADAEGLTVYYDADRNPAAEGIYTLTAKPAESGNPYLAAAVIKVTDGSETLYSLQICWQKEGDA